MTDLVLGVDPGKTGALAVWSPVLGLVDVHDMPAASGAALGSLVRELLEDYEPDRFRLAVVEDVHAMPKQGVTSVWSFSACHNAVLGALGALGVPVELVSPAKWKRSMGLSMVLVFSRVAKFAFLVALYSKVFKSSSSISFPSFL